MDQIKNASVGTQRGREDPDLRAQKMIEAAARRSDVPAGIALVLSGITPR